MNQGIQANRYHIIPRVLIFITRGEEVLLIQGASHKRLWANLYNGIGGHVERGENIIQAARRELAEETGLLPTHLTPPRLWLCGVLSVEGGEPTGIGVFIFRGDLARLNNGYAQPSSSPEGDLAWIHPSHLAALPCLPDLPALLPRCLAHSPTQPPFFALSQPGADGLPVISF